MTPVEQKPDNGDIEIVGPLGEAWAAYMLSHDSRDRLFASLMAALQLESERMMVEERRLWRLTRDQFGEDAVSGKAVTVHHHTGKVFLRPKPRKA